MNAYYSIQLFFLLSFGSYIFSNNLFLSYSFIKLLILNFCTNLIMISLWRTGSIVMIIHYSWHICMIIYLHSYMYDEGLWWLFFVNYYSCLVVAIYISCFKLIFELLYVIISSTNFYLMLIFYCTFIVCLPFIFLWVKFIVFKNQINMINKLYLIKKFTYVWWREPKACGLWQPQGVGRRERWEGVSRGNGRMYI